ncbi:MAG: tetratricopeptide repeat protein [Rubrivivax sp.]|nr:tetratricopeptide repeat protein [Rubrivivax sp.]
MFDRLLRLHPRFALSRLACAVAGGLVLLAPLAHAQAGAEPPATLSAPAPIVNSALDQRLLYQLLVAEMALRSGDAGSAYELILDAARRSGDEGLFRRAVDIALQARAGEQALAASRAWRLSQPESLDAMRLQLQILMVLNRTDALGEPLKALLTQTPAAERPGLIAALPRFLQRASEPRLVASLLEDALRPYREVAATRVPVRVALGRAWLEARDPDRALALAREAQGLEPASPGPALLAMELIRERPAAETAVLEYLRQDKAEPAVRLAYVRLLTGAQRFADAVSQLRTLTQQQPDMAPAYLSLGALQLELKQVKEGEAALLRYIELAQAASAKPPQAQAAPALAPPTDGDDDDETTARPQQGLVQAWLMLAQSAEQQGDFAAAERWLAKVEDPQRALEVQTRRASILVRQGKLAQARELIRRVPERKPEDGRAKLAAEAGMLREAKLWLEAFDVLAGASSRFADDAELLYEQAMMAEKIDRLDEMERLLRRVIELKPDNAHAHNALGYSLADRRLRLPEARQLIQRALELAPGDPFITDSLGWVEFRLGNSSEAVVLLQRAYAARPDTEIAAHLGEVLWATGQRDEARRVWREGKVRDTANAVLRETLARLRVDL